MLSVDLHGQDAAGHPGNCPIERVQTQTTTCHSGPSSYLGPRPYLLRCADRAPGGYCRCTGIGGITVHLLEGPATAHLHQHCKIFIDKYKCSASTRPSRRGVPRGGTRPARRGVFTEGLAEDRQHFGAAMQASSPRNLHQAGGDVALSRLNSPPPARKHHV